MLRLPAVCATAIVAFAPLFCQRVFRYAETLLLGAILAPAQRTVTACLRVMGLADAHNFQNYHRVLNRARWSPLRAGRVLLGLIITRFAGDRPLVFGLDDTLERRRGEKIRAKGIYRDAVRSSHSHFVKASGLRWLSLSLIASVPWSQRRWALPVMTALVPSERYHRECGRRHKKLTDWARQMLLVIGRWLPERTIIVVCDSSFAALELLGAVRSSVTMITRLRLDAALYKPAPERTCSTMGCPRSKGAALPTLAVLLKDRRQRLRPVCLQRWYSQNNREVELLSGTAVWYHAGMTVVPIRWVLVRDPSGRFQLQAFLPAERPASGVVCQRTQNVQRCIGKRPIDAVDIAEFFDVAFSTRYGENPTSPLRRLDQRSCLCFLMDKVELRRVAAQARWTSTGTAFLTWLHRSAEEARRNDVHCVCPAIALTH